ncbi:MAG: hypothetical protein M3Z66_25090 [Chloroflexota bacterium]|nr:hypothetical protein [Chloroflexota bacterium]
MPLTAAWTSGSAAPMLNEVPEVTLAFWVIKVLSTAVGETSADYLALLLAVVDGTTGGRA